MIDTKPTKEFCEAAAASAQDALAWINDAKNDTTIGQSKSYLERSIRNTAFQIKRISRSVDRPMSIGIFGPSQAGKSYLVSVFARTNGALTAVFADSERPEVDFIKELNPFGEKEATGLVTRFSIERPVTPPGFPVALRLLTQTDLLKIFANSYFFDADQEAELHPSPEEIEVHVALFARKQLPGFADVLREEDIWDVADYFKTQLRVAETKVFLPFWDRFAQIAPRLSIPDRADFFSIVWGKHKLLTQLFRTLIESLEKLGFAEDAYCSLASLLPVSKSILNVETLLGLGQEGSEILSICSGNREVNLARPVLTALAAELRIAIKDRPWPLFDHTDILDFPGYKARQPERLERALRDAPAQILKEMVLRGKVDYLFQRYTVDQELTGVLLCVKPSNVNVPTLAAVTEQWISATHGATPEDRRGRPVFLFFVLTMFDQHLVERITDEDTTDSGLMFQARLEASLLQPFGRLPNSWPRKWTPESSFRNCYWVRNPNIKAEGIIEYEGMREVKILDQKVERINRLKQGYAKVPEVLAHFAEPLRAFDEALRLNDGGVSYLAEGLNGVCKPGMKETQVSNRLQDLKQRICNDLQPYFIPTDTQQRVDERTAVVERVVADFDECMTRQMFGTFLRGFCIDREKLLDAFHDARTRSTQATTGEAMAASNVVNTPSRWKGNGLIGMIKANAPSPSNIGSVFGALRSDQNTLSQQMARTAMRRWSRFIHDVCEDVDFASATGIPKKSLSEVASELNSTARRLDLESSIASQLDEILHIETPEQAASKATIIAERIINRFVTSLGQSNPHREIAFDANGIGDRPAPFQQDLVLSWVRGFYDQALRNARSSDGLVLDPEQNERLGSILSSLSI